MLALLAAVSLSVALAATPAPASNCAVDTDYAADVEFALDELEKQCAHLIRSKDIDWKGVRKEFTKAAKKIEDDSEHLRLMYRLLARLRDGHAKVRNPKEIPWPEQVQFSYPDMNLCRIGKKLYVKDVRGDAEELGLASGMEVTKIEGQKPLKWLAAEVAQVSDLASFSTDHHAEFAVLSYGPGKPVGTRLDLELKFEGKKKKRTLTYAKGRYFRLHPGFLPEGLTRTDADHSFGKLPSGHGYVHLRRIPNELPAQLNEILASIGNVPGLVLDFRGNTGGGTDHEAVFGQFLAPDAKWSGANREYIGRGTAPYGGPIVVIVDGTVVSSGETVSGQMKEAGRAYMIGESPTAGMSSQKTTIELPSKLFALYVSVGSNRSSFNEGRGIEGIGIPPHEIVEYTPEDLLKKQDTLILRAVELLEEFPEGAVRYQPEKNGWTPPEK